MTEHHSREFVEAMHAQQLRLHRGAPGIRDEGMLERTTFAAADLFLYFNGLSVEAEQQDVIQLVVMVAAGEIDEAGAAAFFRDHTVKLEG